MQDLIRQMLVELGEDPSREGLVDTPRRVEQAFRFLTKGYQQDVSEVLNGALFTVEYDEMVIVRDIEMYSLCEHHMLPFFGRCHVGYLPQVQERLTQQVAETIRNAINPRGVAVVVEAQHLCMMMRGVQKRNSKMITSAMLGKFREDQRSRMEFLDLVRSRSD
jgi:GTP cyclohydrolase I